MPTSLFSADFQAVYDRAKARAGQPGGPFPSPADWRDQWIYFLMVDRFNNPNAGPNKPPFDNAGFSGFQGGTFTGIRQRLKYIKGLGAGAIWLSPVLKNFPFRGTYHGYGIHDFLRAEPRYADDPKKADDELRALVDAAHEAGLYVIFDIVLNHTGDAFAYNCDPSDGVCNATGGAEAQFRDNAFDVRWRDSDGKPRGDTTPIESITPKSVDALVWPSELQENRFFRRQGGRRRARHVRRLRLTQADAHRRRRPPGVPHPRYQYAILGTTSTGSGSTPSATSRGACRGCSATRSASSR